MKNNSRRESFFLFSRMHRKPCHYLQVSVYNVARVYVLNCLEELVHDEDLMDVLQDVAPLNDVVKIGFWGNGPKRVSGQKFEYRRARDVTLSCANPSSDRVKLTHVLENEVNVPVVVRLVQPDQPYDILVIGERQQKHNLAERTLRIRLISEGVENLLYRYGLFSPLLYRLPYYTVGLRKSEMLLSSVGDLYKIAGNFKKKPSSLWTVQSRITITNIYDIGENIKTRAHGNTRVNCMHCMLLHSFPYMFPRILLPRPKLFPPKVDYAVKYERKRNKTGIALSRFVLRNPGLLRRE